MADCNGGQHDSRHAMGTVKRLICPGLGFGSFRTARRTLAGYEAMAMIKMGQVRNIGGNDIKVQQKFIAEPCQTTA
jgi:hypothetical protein